MAGTKCGFSQNFRTYPNAPAFMDASTNSSAECTVTNTNFAVEPNSRSLCTASIPLKIGMLISVTMTSGWSLQASDTNAAPSAAVPTTSKWPDKSSISALSRAWWSSANSTRGEFKVGLPPSWMCTRSNCKPGRFTFCFDEGIVGMPGAPLGKSLVALTLNQRLSAPSGNSIHGQFGMNETGVTTKGRRFQNALLMELSRLLARGRVQASATHLIDSSTHWTIAWSSFDRSGSLVFSAWSSSSSKSLARGFSPLFSNSSRYARAKATAPA